MIEKAKSESLRYSNELEISVPKADNMFGISEKNWKKLRELIENFSDDFKWFELLLSIAASSFVSFLIAFLATSEGSGGRNILVYAMLITGTASIMAIIFIISKKRDNAVTKKSILKEMDELYCISSEETTEICPEPIKHSDFFVIDHWKATKSVLPQGACFNKLELNGSSILSLSFKITSSSTYWRAGIKLASINSNAESQILTNKSFVLYISKTPGRSLYVEIYLNGNTENSIHKVFDEKKDSLFNFTFERSEKNLVNCYINDKLVYSGKIKSEYLKNLYLCAWGDENDYMVDFKGIKYKSLL